jgi:hypothetical protein
VVEQVVEQLGDPQVVVHPSLLLDQVHALAGKDGRPDRSSIGPGRVDDRGEAAHHDLAVLLGPRRVHVGPREVVAGACGQDLDLPTTLGQAVCDLLELNLRAAYDVGPVPRRHEGETSRRGHKAGESTSRTTPR